MRWIPGRNETICSAARKETEHDNDLTHARDVVWLKDAAGLLSTGNNG
jgi:hypothetical protein